jgi:hypothetical protein
VTVPVCVDEDDFQVDPVNGRLELNHISASNVVEAFTFVLNGAQDVFEEVTDFDPVLIPETGWYTVTMDVRGYAAVQEVGPGSVVAATVSAQMRLDNVVIAGTETMLAAVAQGQPTTTEPAMQNQGTGSCTRELFLTAGQRLEIWAKRNADAGTVTQIISDDDGRCRITAVRNAGA